MPRLTKHEERQRTRWCDAILASVSKRTASSDEIRKEKLETCEDLAEQAGEWNLMDVVRIYCEYELLRNIEPASAEDPDPIHKWKEGQIPFVTMWLKDREHTPLCVQNIFAIHNRSDQIQRYFSALLKIKEERDASGFSIDNLPGALDGFLASVHVEEGCLAPLFLLTGLMSKFDEQWQPIINYYRLELKRRHVGTPEFREMQMSTLSCWLLWGPSIPVGFCSLWQPQPALQFGFGDENNSLPVLDVTGSSSDYAELLAQMRSEPRALRYALTVRPVHAIEAAKTHRICKAQRSLEDESPVILHLVDARRSNELESNYYSAYVWVMFALCRRDQTRNAWVPVYPPSPSPESSGTQPEPWLGLLPIFVHGNLADPSTFEICKAQLAFKALATIDEYLGDGDSLLGGVGRLNSDETRNSDELKLCYVCAVDDPGGCKECAEIASKNREASDTSTSIWSLIERLIEKKGKFGSLNSHVLHHRDLEPNDSQMLSTCNLPGLVDKFYQHFVLATEQPGGR